LGGLIEKVRETHPPMAKTKKQVYLVLERGLGGTPLENLDKAAVISYCRKRQSGERPRTFDRLAGPGVPAWLDEDRQRRVGPAGGSRRL
jgi:hypothetical protein